MKHPLDVKNKLHNQPNHQNEREYQKVVGKQFNQNQPQLRLMMKITIKLKLVVIVKN